MAERVLAECGKIDILVNNAGGSAGLFGRLSRFRDAGEEVWSRVLDLNLHGTLRCIRAVLNPMIERRYGRIVSIASIAAAVGILDRVDYSAAKGALELLTESLAKETEHLGIRAMLVEPGAFRTNFYGEGLLGTKSQISDYDVLADRYRKENLVNKRDQPGDPMKGGEVIVETVLSGKPPFRLLLGSDAAQTAQSVLKDRLQEAKTWIDVSRRSDYI